MKVFHTFFYFPGSHSSFKQDNWRREFEIIGLTYQLKIKDDVFIQGDSPEGILQLEKSYDESQLAEEVTVFNCGTGKCKKSFKTETDAIKHREKKHPPGKRFRCLRCSKGLATLSSLREEYIYVLLFYFWLIITLSYIVHLIFVWKFSFIFT